MRATGSLDDEQEDTMIIYEFNFTKIRRHSSLLFIAAFAVLLSLGDVFGQTPTPQPAAGDVLYHGYRVTSVSEFGFRWRRLNGNENQYRSDLNYKQGFRSFDTNLLLESESGKGKYFDSLLITNSGWGSDPTGYTRVNMDKIGIYKFNAVVRRVAYFNNLSNHSLGEHTQDIKRTFGDFDLTLAPQNDRLRFTFGASFNNSSGPGVWTVRAYGDEFPITSHTKNSAADFRVGAEGKLFGFDWGLTQGVRVFKDRMFYQLTAPNVGNNTGNTSSLTTDTRTFPVDGHDYFTQLHLHRTFAKKLDFTARLIYTSTSTRSSLTDRITGINSGATIVLDYFEITANAKRPQTRGDLGITYMATDKFRISDTFSFDKFAVNGGEALDEQVTRLTGTLFAWTKSKNYRVHAYRKYLNTIEADYQINNSVGFHVGYRFTRRNVNVTGYDFTITSPTSATNPVNIDESGLNSTNTIIAGMKIKPVKNWVIFWDVEHGSADNVFTRLENYKFTNWRARSRWTYNKFMVNMSVITKDNNNPSQTFDAVPLPFGAVIKSRVYTGTVGWNPMDKLQIDAGYTFFNQTSNTVIRVPVTGVFLQGVSQFFVRDHYAYIEVSAKPHKRVSLFATYRLDRDKGQGNLVAAAGVQNILTSYPMQFKTPEFRAAFRITRNVDWNVGYQYYDYRDSQTPSQNYKARLPYTSLRIYFGNGAVDR